MNVKNKINIPFLLMFALILYPLKIRGLKILTYVMIYAVPLAYLLFRMGWLEKQLRWLKKTYAGLGCIVIGGLIIVSALYPIIFSTFDFSFILVFWRMFFLLLIKNLFLVVFYDTEIANRRGDFEEYVNYFLLSNTIYIAFSTLTLLFDGLKNFMLSFLDIEEHTRMLLVTNDNMTTRFGWSGLSVFQETSLCTLGVIFACILIMVHFKETEKCIHYSAMIIVMLIGNMYYGRSGLVISLVSIALLVLYAFSKLKIGYVFGALAAVVLAYISIQIIRNTFEQAGYWYDWAFSAFYNLFFLGKLGDNEGSLGHLMNDMYWRPELHTLLFGDARYTGIDGSYYMHTDAGTMRHILFYGVFNYVLEILAYSVFFRSLSYNIQKVYRLEKKDYYIMIIIWLTACVLFEIKGEMMVQMACVVFPITILCHKMQANVNV